VPDVIASGGARLREVGTTNRTRASDYAAAIGAQTAVLLRVHPSNFRVVGFADTPRRTDLVDLARAHGLAMVEDVGSGSLWGTLDEPAVRESVSDGADVVLFSGDKLLGGPQAGIAVGRAEAIKRMRAHPLYRALRVDKTILAAVERTLAMHIGKQLPPVPAMMAASAAVLGQRANALCEALLQRGVSAEIQAGVARVGGGSLPMHELAGPVVCVATDVPDLLARALRTGEPAVVGRVADGQLKLDVRTLHDSQIALVAQQVAAAVQREP
jgi:L-seryl-tRNA(Ser) seleniumtransferase